MRIGNTLLGPFTDPLQWLAIRHALNTPSAYTADKLLAEFAGLEPELLRLFSLIQMAEGPEQQNAEIILKNGKFYFQLLQIESNDEVASEDDQKKQNGTNQEDGNSDTKDAPSIEINKKKIGLKSKSSFGEPSVSLSVPSFPLYAWFSEELSSRLPSPSDGFLNGVRRYFCTFCNQVFAQPNPVVLHLLYACPRRELLTQQAIKSNSASTLTSNSSGTTNNTTNSTSITPISTLTSSSSTSTLSTSSTSSSNYQSVATDLSKNSSNYIVSKTSTSTTTTNSNKKRAFDIESLVKQDSGDANHSSVSKKTAGKSQKDETTSSARCNSFKSTKFSESNTIQSQLNPTALLNSGLNPIAPYPALGETSSAFTATSKADSKLPQLNPYSLGASSLGLGSQFELAALYAYHQRQLLQFLMPSAAGTSQQQQQAAAAVAAAAAYSPLSFLPPHSLGLNSLGQIPPTIPASTSAAATSSSSVSNSLSGLHNLASLTGLPGLNNLNGFSK